MKINKLYSAALFVAALSACKNKDGFKISGEVSNFSKAKKVYLLAADSASVNVVDSSVIAPDGKFEFKRSTPFANLFKLRAGDAIFDLIAKNGDDIAFKTDLADSAHTYQVSGSDESQKIQDFNKISNIYSDKNTKLVADYQAKANKENQDSLLKVYTPIFQTNLNEYSQAILKFVNENKKSLAGFYAATSLDAMRYEADLVKYADEIKDDFKDNPGVQTFVKQMELAKPLSVGHKAPEFETTGIDDKQVKLADFKGKYVLVDFWASWCAPCRAENPNVVRLYKQYHDKGLNILGVSLDTDKKDWQKAVDADKLTWQHASDLKRFEGPTEMLYHIEAIPSNFFIDPQGVIVAKNVTGIDLEEILKKTFSKP